MHNNSVFEWSIWDYKTDITKAFLEKGVILTADVLVVPLGYLNTDKNYFFVVKITN